MYPEHEKLARAQGDIDQLGKFIDWLRSPSSRFRICCPDPGNEDYPAGWYPDRSENKMLIYLYLGIDPAALERERREMEDYHVPAALPQSKGKNL